MPGWCTSGDGLEDSPEVEVLCGGVNTKTPQHAALWRQGHLLHFGFQEAPSELNVTGRALLENALVYIARFRDDRPIATTPSVFVDPNYPRPRAWLLQALDNPKAKASQMTAYLGKELAEQLAAQPLAELRSWLQARRGFLAAGPKDGLLVVDADAEWFGTALDAPGFVPALVAAAKEPERQARALALLARRVPQGPGASATAADWQAFVSANRDWLFFSDAGGQRWYVDPLARQRKTPSAELRGPRRATPGR